MDSTYTRFIQFDVLLLDQVNMANFFPNKFNFETF